MNLFRKTAFMIALMLTLGYSSVSAKNIMVPKAYMFGFVASFNDSIIFMTDIQEVDSVWVQDKKKLLAGRSSYAWQLREFFSKNFNLTNRTCVVISDVSRKKVEKKYAQMKKQYVVKGAGKYDVHYTDASEFRFTPVNMEDPVVEQKPAAKPKKDSKKGPKDKPRKGPKGRPEMPKK